MRLSKPIFWSGNRFGIEAMRVSGTIFWAGLLGTIGAVFSGPALSDDRPNVLMIITDDQRWDCISLCPTGRIVTPNIDRLGREGIYFANHFCTTSLCSPTPMAC